MVAETKTQVWEEFGETIEKDFQLASKMFTIYPSVTLAELLRGSRDFDHPVYMCFVNSEKAYDHVPQGILWGCWGSMGYWSCFYKLSCPCTIKVRAVSVFLAPSLTRSQCVLDSARVAPCHWSGLWFSLTGSQGVVVKRRASGLGTSGLHLYFLRMMWFCWLLQVKTSAHWSSSLHIFYFTYPLPLTQLTMPISINRSLNWSCKIIWHTLTIAPMLFCFHKKCFLSVIYWTAAAWPLTTVMETKCSLTKLSKFLLQIGRLRISSNSVFLWSATTVL